MKKKLIAGVTAITLFAGGSVVGASVNDYINDMKNWEEGHLNAQLSKEFEEQSQNIDKQLYNDTITHINTKYDEIEKDSIEYLTKSLEWYQQDKMNINAEQINIESENIKVRAKDYINQLMLERFGVEPKGIDEEAKG